MTTALHRYRIIRNGSFLCVAMARDEAHALKIARQNFTCGPETYARLETPEQARAVCEEFNRWAWGRAA